MFRRAYLEHIRRGDFRRVFPVEQHFKEDFAEKLSMTNRVMAEWFSRKCKDHAEWC